MSDVISLHGYRLAKLGGRRDCKRSESARSWYDRAVAIEVSDPVGARDAYRRALEGNPELADAWCNLGRMVHEAGEVADAESCYRLALCAARDVAVYWFNLGVALEDQGRAAEAIASYREAVARDARLGDAHFNLARIYERAGDLASARAAVRHWHAYRALTASRAVLR